MAITLAAPIASIAASLLHDGPAVRVELLDGWQDDENRYIAGLRLSLDEGWWTYWRSPGQFGLPPHLEIDPEGDVDSVRIHFPAPSLQIKDDILTIGYSESVVLPVELFTRKRLPKTKGALSGTLHFGICKRACIPVSIAIKADLKEAKGDSADRTAIRESLANRPGRTVDALEHCRIESITNGQFHFSAEIARPELVSSLLSMSEDSGPDSVRTIIAVPELEDFDLVYVASAISGTASTGVHAMSSFEYFGEEPIASADLSAMQLTLVSPKAAKEFFGCV